MGLGCHGTRPDLPDTGDVCCYGSAANGHQGCTCWDPVYDLEQTDPAPAAPTTAAECCGDCAFRSDSPERAGADGYKHNSAEEIAEMVGSPNGVFYCHQGLRLVVAWRHPGGMEIPAHAASYRPPIVDGVAYRADGTPADVCAGFAAERAALLDEETGA